MAISQTDRDWEELAQLNPYWAVASLPEYQNEESLTSQLLDKFFDSGETYVAFVFETVERHVQAAFRPSTCLDFGCGVGRLVIPFARRCEFVAGWDVSRTMLDKARTHCSARGITNVNFTLHDDALMSRGERFDFIHSFIVFQHIPTARGMQLLQGLLDRLDHGGIGVLHFTYAKGFRRQGKNWRLWSSVSSGIKSLARRFLQRLRLREPQMQMNDYCLNSVFTTLHEAGVRRLHVEYTDHGGCYGAILFFQKQQDMGYRA